jgi:hypothetical protein
MSEEIERNVDTNSTEFNEGVEAGLNSAEDTQNWKAGNTLGQALRAEGEMKETIDENSVNESATPLFLRDSTDGRMGNAQDEKDETGE